MAYNKKTWKARQGLGLNKFSIDGATPVPIVNQPDSVTQQGDALSAGNLNDLEQRIADAFDDVEESKDALQSQINQHESRLENLEQKAGDYSIVQYRGTNAVPTGKAKYGLVKSFVGKSRAWNQLVQNGDFESVWHSQSSGCTVSVSNNILTLTRSSEGSGSINIVEATPSQPWVKGHKYLAFIEAIKNGTASTLSLNFYNGGYDLRNTMGNLSNAFVRLSALFEYLYDVDYSENMNIYLVPSVLNIGESVEFKNFHIHDLTTIFGAGNEPSTVADALAQLSALGQYNAYNAGSLVSTEVSGVKSVGVNIWDEEWELGNINNKTSALEPTNNAIRATNYTKVKPNSVIHIYCGSGNKIGLFAYDENKTFIGVYVSGNFVIGSNSFTDLGNHSVTLPLNCHYIKIKFGASYGSSYKNDTQISIVIGSVSTVNTTYHPYKTDTLSLSETVTLRSAGSVADELDVESGEIVRNVGRVLGSVFTISKFDDYNNHQLIISAYSGMARPASNSDIANIRCAFYATSTADSMFHTVAPNGIAMATGGGIIVCDSGYDTSNSTSLANFIDFVKSLSFVYELATPTTESVSPTIDNTIYTEGGGTIDTVQTQTPVIDNCLDVGYLTI